MAIATSRSIPRQKTQARTQVLPVNGGGWFFGESGKRRMVAGLIGLLLLVGAGCYLTRLALDPVRSAVTQVDVLGTLDYSDREQLRERVAPHLVDGFYRLDIAAIRSDLMAMPWVSDAQVRRVWPAGLTIMVQEHVPVARWNDDALLAADLTLFHPPQLRRDDPRYAQWQAHLSDLPRLNGADGRHGELLERFRGYAARLASLGLTLRYLREDDRLSQTLELADGTSVRLGYENRIQRLARFIDVYPRVMRQLAATSDQSGAGPRSAPDARTSPSIGRFDMRYSNGFALSGTTPSLDS